MQPHEGVLQVLTLNFSDLTHRQRAACHIATLCNSSRTWMRAFVLTLK